MVAILGLGVRLAAIASWSRQLTLEGDQAFYHLQANDLADWLGFTYRHPAGENITTAVHPPLHSSVLALASLLGLDSPGWHRVIGALLGAGTVLVAGLVARRMVGDRAAVLAAAVVAVAPTLWINDAMVLSESTYALTVAMLLLAAVELVARPTRGRAAALGAAVALATLARAEAAALVVVLAVPVVLALRAGDGSRLPRRSRVALLGWLALAGVAVGLPWVGRNLTAFERPALVSTGGGFVLEIASCDETFSGDLLGYWSVTCDGPWAAGDETATEAVKRERGLEYLTAHRDRLPIVVAARVARMWDVWRPAQSVTFNDFFERRGRATSQWAIWAWWAMLVIAVPGVWALRRRAVLMVPFAAVAVTTSLAAAMSFGITRYRTGLEVAIAILAGVGVDRLLRWRASTRHAPAPIGAAPLGAPR